MNTFNITLDLNKGNVTTPIRLRQGDLDGTTITALILDHGATADLTGLTARFVMELPGGEHYYRKDATVGEGSVTVTINEEQAASVTGRTTRAYFQLLDGETVRASTGSVTVDILPDALEGHTVPADYDSAIQDAIDALDDAVENIADTVEDVLEDHPEWTTTVQDGAVTDAKLYQGTDGILARNARLMYRLDNLLTATLPEGDSATATDAAKTPLAGLALYGRSAQDGTPTPSAPVPIVSVGTANLLPNLATSKTQNGVTFTANEDGSISLSGTATANTALLLWRQNQQDLSELSGQVVTLSGGVSSSIYLVFYDTANHVSNASNVTFTVGTIADTGTEGTSSRAFLYVTSGTVTDGTTVRPMLNAGSTAYPYVPYGNAGLWAKRTSDASVYTVTPIDLDGHELRSLPDGTRDEVVVDEWGHARLIQRVGHGTIDGTNIKAISVATPTTGGQGNRANVGMLDGAKVATSGATLLNFWASAFTPNTTALESSAWRVGQAIVFNYSANVNFLCIVPADYNTVALANEWFAANPVEVVYELATPVTIDLGWTDAIPLCGPDLTAQAVPSAPFALTYERDLNTTLARLEAAIAALA